MRFHMNISTYTPEYNGPSAIVYKKGGLLNASKSIQNRIESYGDKFEETWMELQDGNDTVWAFQLTKDLSDYERSEKMRLAGNALAIKVNALGLDRIKIEGPYQAEICEGAILGNYQFLKFFSDAHKRRNSFVKIFVEDENSEILGEFSPLYVALGRLVRDLADRPAQFDVNVRSRHDVRRLDFNRKRSAEFELKSILDGVLISFAVFGSCNLR